MNYNEFIEEISEKYGYDEELKNAIKQAIPLMIEDYKDEEGILNVFRTVRIFATNDMSKPNRNRIEAEMLRDTKSYVQGEESDLYNNDRDPGSYYSYETIFDENLDVVGEIRWLVVEDTKDTYRSEEYKSTFGTTINFPYFLHEIGHAYGMQNPVYSKNGNEIYSKHGMFEERKVIIEENGKNIAKSVENKGVILEEAENELHAQRQLMSLFGVNEYKMVKEKLTSIGHVTTDYNQVLLGVVDNLEDTINIRAYRNNNDFGVIKDFNEKSMQNDIAQKYISDCLPYDYLEANMYALFDLAQNKYKMSFEEYGRKTRELMVEAQMPICSYKGMELEKFETIKDNLLGTGTKKTV